jgi:hypothetical protein
MAFGCILMVDYRRTTLLNAGYSGLAYATDQLVKLAFYAHQYGMSRAYVRSILDGSYEGLRLDHHGQGDADRYAPEWAEPLAPRMGETK